MRIGLWFLSYGIVTLALAQGCSEKSDADHKRDAAADSDAAVDSGQDQDPAAGSGGSGSTSKSKANAAAKSGIGGSAGSTPPPSPTATRFESSAEPPPNPLWEPPEWSFVGSADSQPLRPRHGAAPNALVQDEVKRGDLYYVLSEQRILNLSAYRGLQIIDASNVNQPRIEGRLPLAGEPVELYVLGERVLVLYNDTTEWQGSADNADVHIARGAQVVSVDIQDRSHPRLLARTRIAEPIVTSRVVVKGGKAALYVLAGNKMDAQVLSFDVTTGALAPKGELDLGGSVRDIDATLELLMIVSGSTVSLVDISMADGSMALGGEVAPQGMVNSRFEVDAVNGVLRVASTGYSASYLQTYSLNNLLYPELLATCELPEHSSDDKTSAIATTLLLEDRAFIVSTYEPNALTAVSIAEDGQCQVHPSFMSSARDAFLFPALKQTRLVGIGNDAAKQRSRLTVSLYDATNLDNSMPLTARVDAELEDNGSSSIFDQPEWDERAFSIQEDVGSAKAADGTLERGVVLLPHNTLGTGVAETQIFTFSDHTLTKRGSMNHRTQVKRAFQVREATIANLSEEQLSLFDATDPDAIGELSRLDLTPDFSRVLVYGDRIARVCEPLVENESAKVQIVDRAADLDGEVVATSFEVPTGASYYQLGQLLVTLKTERVGSDSDEKYNTRLQVYDLTDPDRPKQRGSLESDRFDTLYTGELLAVGVSSPSRGSSFSDLFDSDSGTGSGAQSFVMDHAIALVSSVPHEKDLGNYEQCVREPPESVCYVTNTGKCRDPYYRGRITCITPEGGKQTCTGSVSYCDDNNGGCKRLDELPEDSTETCNDLTDTRRWHSLQLDTIDLQDPDQPVLRDRVEFPEDEEATSALADGNIVYLNYQKPTTTAGATRVFVNSYTRQLDFRDPSNTAMREPINLPGRLIYARGDKLYTESYEWDDDAKHTVISRLTIDGELVQLQASHNIGDRHVSYVRFDDSHDHVLVSTDTPDGDRRFYQLMVLDAQSLDVLSDTDLNLPVQFATTLSGRAIFNTERGLLVYDVEDASRVRAAAYYPTSLGDMPLVDFSDTEVIFAAGLYGVQRFDIATGN